MCLRPIKVYMLLSVRWGNSDFNITYTHQIVYGTACIFGECIPQPCHNLFVHIAVFVWWWFVTVVALCGFCACYADDRRVILASHKHTDTQKSHIEMQTHTGIHIWCRRDDVMLMTIARAANLCRFYYRTSRVGVGVGVYFCIVGCGECK